MLKSTTDVNFSLLTKIINPSIRNGCFPDELKAPEVTPIFKKNDGLDKENYKPAICQMSLKESCLSELEISWKISYQNCLQISGKTIAPNII